MIVLEKFSHEANGYSRSEVNQFISNVITETEDIVLRCQSQRDEIIELKKQLEHYKNIEDTLKVAIMRAEKMSDDIKRMANAESEAIINQAKENASKIVNEALLRANDIDKNTEQLKKNIDVFKKKLRLILKQQLKVVDEIELLELEP